MPYRARLRHPRRHLFHAPPYSLRQEARTAVKTNSCFVRSAVLLDCGFPVIAMIIQDLLLCSELARLQCYLSTGWRE